jgi:hypothetical protein
MEENKFSFEFSENILKVHFPKGHLLTPELILEVYTKEYQLLKNKEINDLWDLRGCAVSNNLNSNSMQNIVDKIKEIYSSDSKHLKTALLIETELGLGMTRMFQIIGDDLPFKIEVFKEETRAKSWLTNSGT